MSHARRWLVAVLTSPSPPKLGSYCRSLLGRCEVGEGEGRGDEGGEPRSCSNPADKPHDEHKKKCKKNVAVPPDGRRPPQTTKCAYMQQAGACAMHTHDDDKHCHFEHAPREVHAVEIVRSKRLPIRCTSNARATCCTVMMYEPDLGCRDYVLDT